ncbi:hypothetical protein BTH42_19090 [Burkholderia sp. SRS-W-2-2016]|uniref:RsbRD N-terminal domain-containing protein n=1 Tax=Burkholderia sp. SRS-W-2-2016 TaxID=1926878 RepID=UPI00094B374B|nr:RsbRD N-terminal domain-containing protein [Burkholderia sp. SRS-W-2-2016]OLL30064.1 hypothetical protein BTH42_19090 [Burkholderia sp. SRS-W-2-2016]
MSLADFIESDLAGLIDDWAEYALAVSQEDSDLSESQLRDSAAEIRTAIADDMRNMQSVLQQESDKDISRVAQYISKLAERPFSYNGFIVSRMLDTPGS